LLPDGWNAPRTAARTRTKNEGGGAELGASSSSSPALPADIRREILSFAGTRAVVATDESLRRPLRVARWAAPRAGAPTALVVHDVLGRLEDVGILPRGAPGPVRSAVTRTRRSKGQSSS